MWDLDLTKILDKGELESKMQQGLYDVSAVLESAARDFSNFSKVGQMTSCLRDVHALVPTIKTQKQQQNILKLLRLYIFLVERHANNIWPVASDTALGGLTQQIQLITEAIGKVPQLRSQVIWANPEFLPPNINRATKTGWQKQLCPDPTRGSSASRNEIHFIGVPRKALKEERLQDNLEYINAKDEKLYLNLIDFEYYELGLMHADHLVASANLINRINEMIEAMNLDSSFAEEMQESLLNDGYFARDEQNKIVGTYWLYMAYHNSIENLWLLLASDNTGAGKGARDPITWLNESEIGLQYLEYLRSENKMIDTSDILYRVRSVQGLESVSLKESFSTWAKTSKHRLIYAYQIAAEYHQVLRNAIATHADNKKALVLTELNIEAIKLSAPHSSLTYAQVPSIVTDETRSIVNDAKEIIRADQTLKDLEMARETQVLGIVTNVIHERKAKRSLEANPAGTEAPASGDAKKPRTPIAKEKQHKKAKSDVNTKIVFRLC